MVTAPRMRGHRTRLIDLLGFNYSVRRIMPASFVFRRRPPFQMAIVIIWTISVLVVAAKLRYNFEVRRHLAEISYKLYGEKLDDRE